MKKLLTLLLLSGLVWCFSACDKSDSLAIDIDAEIQATMEAEQIPSVVAAVVKGDEIVWEGTYGFANKHNGDPATRHSSYTIMSIGKLVLSTAIFQLWEQSAIDLEADINQYLPFTVRNPNFPDQKITPSMLLNHTAGLAWPADSDRLPDFHHFYGSEEPPLISEWLPEYILPGGSQYRSTVWKDFPPGEAFLYSNIGTSLLALVLEEISGEDYRDYCQIHIFEPLEMHQTAFRFQNLNQDLLVTPYYENGYPFSYYSCRHYPAGFISSDLEDFSHFVIAILNAGEYRGKRILQAATVDKMLELQDANSGTANLWVHCLGDCVGHRGGGTGFATWAEWHLQHDRAMFIFSNIVNESVYPTGRLYELVKYQAFQY